MTIKTSRHEKSRENKSISPARWIWDGRLKSKVWNPKGVATVRPRKELIKGQNQQARLTGFSLFLLNQTTLAKSFWAPLLGSWSWVLGVATTRDFKHSSFSPLLVNSNVANRPSDALLAVERLLLPRGGLRTWAHLRAACLLRSWRACDRLMPFPKVVPLPLL